MATCRRPVNGRDAQGGVALVVALILLLVITLVGLAGVRSTIMQQKMASNLYDRQIAFQSAEAAMREATTLLASDASLVARNCQTGGVTCPSNPFDDTALSSSAIHTMTTAQFQASSVASGQPQYVIENMGNWTDTGTDTGFSQTANAHNYGAQGLSATNVFYRITARSGDPTAVKNRAVVTLQAMLKKS